MECNWSEIICIRVTSKSNECVARVRFEITRIQDFSQYQYFIDPVGNKVAKFATQWFFCFFCFSFSCNLIGYLKQALKSDWLFCFSVPFSLAGEMVRFGAIWEYIALRIANQNSRLTSDF